MRDKVGVNKCYENETSWTCTQCRGVEECPEEQKECTLASDLEGVCVRMVTPVRETVVWGKEFQDKGRRPRGVCILKH